MKTYINRKNRKIYKIIGTAKMKNVQTREWEKAFIYSEFLNNRLEKQIYVREENDFNQRFQQW